MNHAVSESLLKGQLGGYGGGLLDVVITPDGNTAIISNFGRSTIYLVDISGGFNGTPTVKGSIFTTMFAEDIALTPDGKYALVTDGGLSSRIGVFDIAHQSLVRMYGTGNLDAQAIEVTPDGQMAIIADYLGGAIHAYWLDGDGQLTFKETQLILPFWPVNVAVSPDSKTVLVPIAFNSVLPVFSIDSQHNLCFKEFIPLPGSGSQSCVFSQDGTKAYLLVNGNFGRGTLISVLNITGPGKVSASGTVITVEPTRGTGQFFGIDTIALDPSNNYLYVTNPTSFGIVAGFSVLDLTTNTQMGLFTAKGIPTGIAFTTQQ
jgi:DNA-binding beta-propeller fold protein YncE